MNHRPSPATLIALVALFFALTGAGVAATSHADITTSTVTTTITIKPGETKTATVACPAGNTAISGGYEASTTDVYYNGTPVVLSSYPSATGSWTVVIENPDQAGYASQSDNWDHYTVEALCE